MRRVDYSGTILDPLVLVALETLQDHRVRLDRLSSLYKVRLDDPAYKVESNRIGHVTVSVLEAGDKAATGDLVGTIANRGGPLMLVHQGGLRMLLPWPGDGTNPDDFLIEGGQAIQLDFYTDVSITSVGGTTYVRDYLRWPEE